MAQLEKFYNIADLREAARRRLPKAVFEYIDRGTEDEVSLSENRAAFNRLTLRTRFMVDLSERDMGTEIFGKRIDLPIIIAPTGIAGLCWYEGELALAQAAAAAGIPFTLAMSSLTPLESIAAQAGGRPWYQLYMWEEEELSYEMVGRARDLNFEALVVTIDSALGRAREYNHRNGFSVPLKINPTLMTDLMMHPRWLTSVMFRYFMNGGMPNHANYPAQYKPVIASRNGRTPKRHEAMTWKDIARMRDFWPGKLIVKSILSADQARQAVDHGADAIVVSNHGGRALDGSVPTIDVLPEIVAAVGERTTIILDSGIRRGSDIVKAVALGADAVMVGRATLYGTAAAGMAGATKALGILGEEFERSMGYVGCRNVQELDPTIFGPTNRN
ncbi:MAG: alpha-hydroxy acid oxidase [Alphaproteobacteria bacterium]